MDHLTPGTLQAVHDRFLRELNAHANGERSIRPSDADIAQLRGRLAVLDRLIARQARVGRA